MPAEEKIPGSKLNTILLWVTLGVLAFVGVTSWNNSIQLAEMHGSQITRTEVESKLAQVQASIIATDKDVIQLKLDISQLQPRPKVQ